VGHNSEAALAQVKNVTVFQQFEAIVDSPDYTSAQKCMLVKIRCRVDAKTMDNAIVSNEGLMRAASLKDPRALRAELRDLQGKGRDLPAQRDNHGRPTNDPVDHNRATIAVEERPGKASVIGFTPERLHAIVAAYLQHREQKRGPGRPPASGAPPLSGKPPERDAGGLGGKPPASGTGGLEKPPASHAENPLRPTHPDPFPISRRPGRAAQSSADEALAAYNVAAAMHGFTACRTLTDARRKRLEKRLDDIGGVDALNRALSAIPNDHFLMGKAKPRPGEAPFRLSIDRLLSTESGMGDVLARLLDAAGDGPKRDMTYEEEVQALLERNPGTPVDQVQQAVIAARRARGD
jgi:hypothetical protein